jgi:hypothetical protein
MVLEVHGLSDEHPFFHVEIQTGYDSLMDVRMVKYGYLIGTSRLEIDFDDISVITILLSGWSSTLRSIAV